MNVKERLLEVIKYNKISVRAFEVSIGASNGYVKNISKSIGLDKMEKFIEIYSNINIEWLITGKGSMLKSESNTFSNNLVDLLNYLIENNEKLLKHETYRDYIQLSMALIDSERLKKERDEELKELKRIVEEKYKDKNFLKDL